jgi:hypothetical protein
MPPNKTVMHQDNFLKKTPVGIVLWVLLLFFMFPSSGLAGVVIFDGITMVGMPVYLKVHTKGRLFTQGGRLVDVYIDQKHAGKILSGGDGYGFFKYTPRTTGMKTVSVRSGTDEGTGDLLVLDKTEKVILVEIEALLRMLLFSPKTITDSKTALNTLNRKYKIIYLTRFMGTGLSKKILTKGDYPSSAILLWRGAETLDELHQKGVCLYAVIASLTLLSESSEHINKRFTFEETEDETYVDNWEDLLKRLK